MGLHGFTPCRNHGEKHLNLLTMAVTMISPEVSPKKGVPPNPFDAQSSTSWDGDPGDPKAWPAIWNLQNKHTHTHLLRNILSNYWCGMHLTCKRHFSKICQDRFGRLDMRNCVKEIFLRPCSKVHQVLMQLKLHWWPYMIPDCDNSAETKIENQSTCRF